MLTQAFLRGGQCLPSTQETLQGIILGEGGTDPAYCMGRVTSLTLHSGDAVSCEVRRRGGRYAGLNRVSLRKQIKTI